VELECRRAARENTPSTVKSELWTGIQRVYEIRFLPSPSGIAAYSMEVTEAESPIDGAGESEAKLRRLIDAAPAFISYVGTDYRYRIVNMAYERNFGYAPNTVVGLTISEVLGPTGWTVIEPYVERAMAGE
jgi:PAS domain-containing protein